MLKMFREFRKKLTYEKLIKILRMEGIIVAIVSAIMLIIQPWENVDLIEGFKSYFIFGFVVLGLTFMLLDGMNKYNIHESEEVKSRLNAKFQEDEPIQVDFKPTAISGDVKKFLRAPYEIFDLHYVARKRGDEIVVTLMQGEEELKNYPMGMEDCRFFEANFKFPETEEKE